MNEQTSWCDYEDMPEFECEGWFTQWCCPRCEYIDWSRGDTRGKPVECTNCGLKGVMGTPGESAMGRRET